MAALEAICGPVGSAGEYKADEIVLRGGAGVLWQMGMGLGGVPFSEETLYEGRAGTGKSVGICKLLVDRCKAWPGSQHLICRQTRESMTDSILVTLESVIGDQHPEVTRCGRGNRHSYHIGGSEIICGGLDQPAKMFSTGWDTIYLNEGIEADLAAWELFARSARDPRLRRGTSNQRPRHMRIADTNPGPPNHWLNTRAFPASDVLRMVETGGHYCDLDDYNSGPQRGMRRIIGVHMDNPSFFDSKAWRWLPDGLAYLNNLRSMTGHRAARMLHGLWVAAEGGVFPEFGDGNIVDPFDVPEDWPWYCAIDPGEHHPCGIVWITVSPLGKLYVVDEVKMSGIGGVDGAAAIIHKKSAGRNIFQYYGDPRMVSSQTFHSTRNIIQQFAEKGILVVPWPITTGKAAKESAVSVMRQDIVSRRIRVFKTCTETIGEFRSWRYKKNAKGEMLDGDDMMEDRNNDLLDPLMGLVAACPRHDSIGAIKIHGDTEPQDPVETFMKELNFSHNPLYKQE